MGSARKSVLLLVAALFGVAQAYMAPYLDPGYEGAGGAFVRAVTGVPTGEQAWTALHAKNRQIAMSRSAGPATLGRAFKGPTTSQSAAAAGQIGALWMDPSFTFPPPIEAELVDDTSASDMACGGGGAVLVGTSLAGAPETQLASARGKCQDVLA